MSAVDQAAAPPTPTRGRWWLAILLGTLLWAAALGASFVLPQVLLGLRMGPDIYAIAGLLQLLLGGLAIVLACRVGRLRWARIGITGEAWQRDLLIGLAVAAAFAVLQFGLIIPLTGGAARSDVATNLEQLRGGNQVLLGLLTLGVLGAVAEELLFRGLLLNGIGQALGGRRWAKSAAVLVVVLLFGAAHGYQGWSGVIDTALYGGLTLSLLCLWRGGRITVAIAAHAGWNAIAVACMRWLY